MPRAARDWRLTFIELVSKTHKGADTFIQYLPKQIPVHRSGRPRRLTMFRSNGCGATRERAVPAQTIAQSLAPTTLSQRRRGL